MTSTDLRHCSFDELGVDGSVDLILTDPPYIPATDAAVERFLESCGDWLRPGGSLVAMLGQRQLGYALPAIARSGLTYRWTLAYMLPGANGRHWPYKFYNGWKPLVWATKGPSRRRRWIEDRIVSRRDKQHHVWGQGVWPFVELALAFSRRDEMIVDPFLGAGTTAVAAVVAGRHFVGSDVDPVAVQRAQARVDAAVEYRLASRGRSAISPDPV